MKLGWPHWLGITEIIAALAICAFVRGAWMIYRPAGYLVLGTILFVLCWFAPHPPDRSRG
ncbi:MAG: hypothetical protein ACLP1Y_09395 [Candidatus Acidiferrales bacterium]